MKSVYELIDRYQMVKPGELVVCAVSGGADSMCLLDVMIKASAELGFKTAAMHFNHRLRGAQSDRDESFVGEYCKKRGITFYSGSGDVKEYARKKGMGIEEAARILRYAFFEETAAKADAARVATAHNACDNAETVIMNMARGSGLRGLCGIPPVRGIFIRPLLACTRDEILRYLSDNNIEHIEDETNFLPLYTRNRVRLNVVPQLLEIWPGFIGSVSENSELLRKDEDFLSSMAEDFLVGATVEGHSVRLKASLLNELHFSIGSRVIRKAAAILDKTLNSVHIDSIFKLSASKSPSGRLSLPGGLLVFRDYADIVFSINKPENESFGEICLELGKWMKIPELGMEFFLDICSESEKIHTSFNTFFFKKDNIYGNIIVRPRLAGDKIELLGKKGTKTVKKLFIELKIPVYERDRIPLICDEKEVLAIPGIGVSSKHAAKSSENALTVICRKINENQ